MTGLRDLINKMTRPPDELRGESLREWADRVEGTTRLSDVEPRQRTKVVGVIQNVRIDPREGRNFIEATVIDGSGRELVVRLTGRMSLAGWQLGEGLVVEGTVAERDGIMMMLNPEWDLIAGPEHG